MDKIIHVSQLPRLNNNRIRYNNGMEVLLTNGWHKVIFDDKKHLTPLKHGINKDKDKT